MLWLRREFYLLAVTEGNCCFLACCYHVKCPNMRERIKNETQWIQGNFSTPHIFIIHWFWLKCFDDYLNLVYLCVCMNSRELEWILGKYGEWPSSLRNVVVGTADNDDDNGRWRRERKYAPKIMTLNHKWVNLFDGYRRTIAQYGRESDLMSFSGFSNWDRKKRKDIFHPGRNTVLASVKTTHIITHTHH